MDISVVTFWNNYQDHLTDAEFYKKELTINKLLEPLLNITFSTISWFSFSGMSFEKVKKSLTLYAEQVIPELRRWTTNGAQKCAA